MTHPNATPGKAIYLDGVIYEGWIESLEPSIGLKPIFDNKLPCPDPHPFTNYQTVVEGVDYVKQRQIRALGLTEWNNCTQKEYETTYSFPQERRIIALPLQAEKPEGEKECTCKLTDKNHALCPVCDKEQYEKSMINADILKADKLTDNRFDDPELFNFIISPDKPMKVSNVRPIINSYYREEITFSRLVEMLNEIVYKWKQSKTP